jgi:hypothetical protein
MIESLPKGLGYHTHRGDHLFPVETHSSVSSMWPSLLAPPPPFCGCLRFFVSFVIVELFGGGSSGLEGDGYAFRATLIPSASSSTLSTT